MNYFRGSEWRKWDLHLHSLYTNLNNKFHGNIEEYINKIKDNQISVVGLTNYFNFSEEDYKLKDKLEENGIVVFLNLEFRLSYQNNDNQNCDFHVIFDNKITDDSIKMFLSNLTVNISGLDKKANKMESDDFKISVVDYATLLDTLEDESLGLNGRYLLGFLSRGHGNSRTSSVYEQIAKKSNFVIHSSDKEENISEDRSFWLEVGKPLIQSSDSHSLDEIGSKFTRIKADTTFDGLKQILYEPGERIRIQENNPNFDFDKPYFKKIIIDEDIKVYNQEDSEIKIKKAELELNNNLVAIIGGRGTGKSTLIGCINNVFWSSNEFLKSDNLKIIYSKNNDENPSIMEYISGGENYLEYIYISQGYLKENADKENISKYVKQLLSIDDNFSAEIIENIEKNTEDIGKLKKWFMSSDLNGNLINSRSYVNEQKKKNEEMLKSIETEKNKQDLTTYTSNIEKIARLQGQISKLDKLLISLDSIEKINEEISQLNSDCTDVEGFEMIGDIDCSAQKIIIERNKQKLLIQMDILKSDNKLIKDKFSRYTGDLESLLSNAELYKKNITIAEQNLKIIGDKENELSNLFEERKKFGELIYNEYIRLKNNIDSGWDNITGNRDEQQKELIENLLLKKQGDDGIMVEGYIDFDEENFYLGLLDILDNRKYKKKEDIKEKIGIDSIESWCDFIKNGFVDFSDNDRVISYFLDAQERSKYIKVNSNITYMRKNLKYLSVGQRGTVLLCLQLATKAFSTPIIFDQPEDDLDNQFIMDELVEIFKELKKYRQIIIVTHNANLVLNADAEQVIVAENDNEELIYLSGAIENEVVREKICNVLEGGEYAFKKRENKYGLK